MKKQRCAEAVNGGDYSSQKTVLSLAFVFELFQGQTLGFFFTCPASTSQIYSPQLNSYLPCPGDTMSVPYIRYLLIHEVRGMKQQTPVSLLSFFIIIFID